MGSPHSEQLFLPGKNTMGVYTRPSLNNCCWLILPYSATLLQAVNATSCFFQNGRGTKIKAGIKEVCWILLIVAFVRGLKCRCGVASAKLLLVHSRQVRGSPCRQILLLGTFYCKCKQLDLGGQAGGPLACLGSLVLMSTLEMNPKSNLRIADGAGHSLVDAMVFFFYDVVIIIQIRGLSAPFLHSFLGRFSAGIHVSHSATYSSPLAHPQLGTFWPLV